MLVANVEVRVKVSVRAQIDGGRSNVGHKIAMVLILILATLHSVFLKEQYSTVQYNRIEYNA